MPGPVTAESPSPRPRERTPGPRPLLRSVLGRQLRRTRQEQDRTLAEVAAAARVSMAYLSIGYWAQGETKTAANQTF
jgi:hypothetical protein